MELQFRVSICPVCLERGAEHAKHNGEYFGAMAMQRGEGPRLPADCQCMLVLVGECSICNLTADQLGLAAKHHVQLPMRRTDQTTQEQTTRDLSICATCLLGLAQVIIQFAQSGQLDVIQQAIAPKILPASSLPFRGAAQLDHHPLSVIPGGKFRRH